MPFKTEPLPYQKEEFERCKDQKYYAHFYSPGLGKSKIVIDNFCYLHSQKKVRLLVVLCPNGVKPNWPKELDLHLWDDIPCTISVWGDDNRKQLMELIKNPPECLIWVMNIEALSHKSGAEALYELLSAYKGASFVAVDESSGIADPKSIRSKVLKKLAPLCTYRRILNGTPISESPLNLPGQVEFLGPLQALLGVGSHYQFKLNHCVLQPVKFGNRKFNLIKGYRNLEELAKRVSLFGNVIRKENVLKDLPDKTYQTYFVELDDKQKKMYKEMYREFETSIEEAKSGEKLISEANGPLAKFIRLQQILSGYINTGEKFLDFSNTRIDALLELIDTLEGKIIIWSSYIHSIERILSVLRRKYGTEAVVDFYGATTARAENIEKFKNEARFFVANPQTGGQGLTFTECQTMIYYNNHHSMRLRAQSEDRIHRIGQKSNVLYIDMLARGTIDEYVLESLRQKKDIMNYFMERATQTTKRS